MTLYDPARAMFFCLTMPHYAPARVMVFFCLTKDTGRPGAEGYGSRGIAGILNKMIGSHDERGEDHDEKHDCSQKGVESNDRDEAEQGIADSADPHE